MTEGIITNREWALMTPSSIHAYQHRGKYLFFWYTDFNNKGGVIFDPRNPDSGFIRINQHYVAGYRDVPNDALYLIDSSKNLVKLDSASGSPLSYSWKSKSVSLAPHAGHHLRLAGADAEKRQGAGVASEGGGY